MSTADNRAFTERTPAIREQIAAAPQDWALFLDLDGTLLDIAEHPWDVRTPPWLPGKLEGIEAGLSGAMAIVSGRPLADIDRLLEPSRFCAAAEHGAEMRLADDREVVGFALATDPLLLAAIEEAVGGFAGVVVEPKATAIAVHYRAAPDKGEAVFGALSEVLAQVGGDRRIMAGRFVFEVVATRISKAQAVKFLLSLPAFAGRTPVFIGDDVSDEEACLFVEEQGGVALRVAGEYFSLDRSAFRSPDEVRLWIATLAGDLERVREGALRA
ncbi:trehalose-phosphatase [Labrys monachus]|uniref:Trehalose 6-phosphate phosphatase n=1 Tax=Labrys monachus TaxID=217067 RepID=A0ABU0FM64_9HYPH|nr:trehalose-phosphatase [Labrys monachus]MDQ0395697.1 trehalose 6-phosphate phosphatase [Labrys monachus]